MLNTKFIINTIEKEKKIVGAVRKNIEFLKIKRIRFTLPEKNVEEEYNTKKIRNV